jgi:phage-related protein
MDPNFGDGLRGIIVRKGFRSSVAIAMGSAGNHQATGALCLGAFTEKAKRARGWFDGKYNRINVLTVPTMLGLDILYKNLYKRRVTRDESNTRFKWEGDSKQEIQSWPDNVREDIGHQLNQIDNREVPLHSKSVGKGIRELWDEDKDFWYRILYALHAGWIYILHSFTKKTNKITDHDMKVATSRFSAAKGRNDPPYKVPEVADEEKKSA